MALDDTHSRAGVVVGCILEGRYDIRGRVQPFPQVARVWATPVVVELRAREETNVRFKSAILRQMVRCLITEVPVP